ncbi:M15 family metallopeptidase [Pasteurellaceae bacterium LIM206]|nr:M15 family metallopeptidase [Pasteurellaceae bacterium LIM206]
MQLTPQMLSGKSSSHLVPLPCPFSDKHALQVQAVKAFLALQKRAVRHGFDLQPASSFRDFQRQRLIWNGKFNGERKVHDDEGNPLVLSALSDWRKCQAILRWSALPGASRHHWGTEIDVFDPHLLPPNQSLQLEPWEYEAGGYFYELSEFLRHNLVDFDFTLPFLSQPQGKMIGREPWHISYLPLAEQAAAQFNPELLLQAWQGEEIAGLATLNKHIQEIFEEYIV